MKLFDCGVYTCYVDLTFYEDTAVNEKIQGFQSFMGGIVGSRMGKVTLGRIMTTQQVVTNSANPLVKDMVQHQNAWSLCGTVSPPLFKLVKAMPNVDVSGRVSVFGTGRLQYLVINHQFSSYQCRFVLPLYEPVVREFLAHGISHPFWYSLAEEGGHNALILVSDGELSESFKHVLQLTTELTKNEQVDAVRSVLAEAQGLAEAELLQNAQTTHVETTLIFPEMTFFAVQETLEKTGAELRKNV